jgi:hypothetical protein
MGVLYPKAWRGIRSAQSATLMLCLRDHQARPIAARHPALSAEATAELVDGPDPPKTRP